MKKRNVLPKAASSGSKPIPSPPKQQFTWLDSSEYCLLMMLVLFRAANALLCRSLFVPDEHWQSLEVAYKMVFKYPNIHRNTIKMCMYLHYWCVCDMYFDMQIG